MKQIIGGKRYDTETATRVGGDESTCSQTDFSYWKENLYRTRNGAWFLAGSGGPLSKYARPYGNNGSQNGSAIRPLTEAEAREWCERHDQDALEKHFAAVIVDA